MLKVHLFAVVMRVFVLRKERACRLVSSRVCVCVCPTKAAAEEAAAACQQANLCWSVKPETRSLSVLVRSSCCCCCPQTRPLSHSNDTRRLFVCARSNPHQQPTTTSNTTTTRMKPKSEPIIVGQVAPIFWPEACFIALAAQLNFHFRAVYCSR